MNIISDYKTVLLQLFHVKFSIIRMACCIGFLGYVLYMVLWRLLSHLVILQLYRYIYYNTY